MNPITRQYALYDFLKQCFKSQPDRWFSAQEISDCFKNSGLDYYQIATDPRTHNPCVAISEDVFAINSDTSYDRVILTKNNCYKLAKDYDEAQSLVDWFDRKLTYYGNLKSIIEKKRSRDGQGKLVNNAGNAMQKGNEEFHNTYGR